MAEEVRKQQRNNPKKEVSGKVGGQKKPEDMGTDEQEEFDMSD